MTPKFGITRQFQEQASGFPDASSYGVGLDMTLPIFDRNHANRFKPQSAALKSGYSLRSGIVEMRSELEQAVEELRAARQESESETAGLAGTRTIAVKADSLLSKKLSAVSVTRDNISVPVLTVTGSIVARLAPGKDAVETRWDFSAPEIATAYADWLKA